MRDRPTQVIRPLVAALQIEPLDPVGEATGQDHPAVTADGQPPHVREQPVLPGDLRIQPARGP